MTNTVYKKCKGLGDVCCNNTLPLYRFVYNRKYCKDCRNKYYRRYKANDTSSVILAVNMPRTTKKAIAILAEANRVSMSAITMQIINNYLDSKGYIKRIAPTKLRELQSLPPSKIGQYIKKEYKND